MSAPVIPMQPAAAGRSSRRILSLADGVAFAAALLLAATGFGGWWGLGRMSGVMLSLHAALGPLFLAALAAAVMLRLAGAQAASSACERGIVAICGWLAQGSALVLGVSILIVLSGYADTVSQATLVGVHRVAAIVFIGSSVMAWGARRFSAVRPHG
ncbi:MAG: hypothetical protein IPM64_03325 [Phycisphaerales bacterium]|nr:hypothetical protein [Phycisphaerales bacterium]